MLRLSCWRQLCAVMTWFRVRSGGDGRGAVLPPAAGPGPAAGRFPRNLLARPAAGAVTPELTVELEDLVKGKCITPLEINDKANSVPKQAGSRPEAGPRTRMEPEYGFNRA